MLQKFIFLDRDGVLIKDFGYNNSLSQFEPIMSTVEFLKHAQNLGYKFVIVSNQSGVAKGVISRKEFEDFHYRFENFYSNEKIYFTEIAYCFHKSEDNCNCRKPRIGLLKEFLDANINKIDFSNSWMVGDKISDMQFALNLGVQKKILLNSKYHDLLYLDSTIITDKLYKELLDG